MWCLKFIISVGVAVVTLGTRKFSCATDCAFSRKTSSNLRLLLWICVHACWRNTSVSYSFYKFLICVFTLSNRFSILNLVAHLVKAWVTLVWCGWYMGRISISPWWRQTFLCWQLRTSSLVCPAFCPVDTRDKAARAWS